MPVASEDEEEEEQPRYWTTEEHWVALPSIIYSNSGNPNHKLHITCMAIPPLTAYELKELKKEDDVST